MNARKRWRRSLIISMALNIFLLCGVGILSAGVFIAEPLEQLIELDLVSEYSNEQSVDSGSEPANVSGPGQMASPNINSTTASNPVAVQTITSLSVDEVSTDFATENDIGETTNQSVPVSGNQSGSSGLNGSGGQSGNGNGNGIGKGNGGQGSGSGKSGGIMRPKILSQVYPTYPESARQAGITGTVLLRVQILENGCAGDVSVKESSGNDSLDDAATTAVYKWRFTPAKEKNSGRAVVCYTTVPVVFRLN